MTTHNCRQVVPTSRRHIQSMNLEPGVSVNFQHQSRNPCLLALRAPHATHQTLARIAAVRVSICATPLHSHQQALELSRVNIQPIRSPSSTNANGPCRLRRNMQNARTISGATHTRIRNAPCRTHLAKLSGIGSMPHSGIPGPPNGPNSAKLYRVLINSQLIIINACSHCCNL